MKKEVIEKKIKALVSTNNTEMTATKSKQYTNELDKEFEEKKLEEKNNVYEQVLVDLQKSDNATEFLLLGIENSEKNINISSEKRKGLRFKIEDGVSINHGENGKLNGNIIAWNEILSVCMEVSSEFAKSDHLSRSGK